MSVFLSYAHEDEAAAFLLIHILKEKGIDCLVDQRLRGGEQLDSSIQDMIRRCDVVLILLTEFAIKSSWVNQEIGFAAGCGKAIWPLAIQRDIKPTGMLQATSSYSLFNWSSSVETINSLVDAINAGIGRGNFGDFPRALGLDHVVHGKIEGRHFYLSRLHDLLADEAHPQEIYIQAAFSHFAASERGSYDEQPTEEIEVAMQQKKTLIKLCQRPSTTLKLLLWPFRNYSARQLETRYQNLLSWMEEVLPRPNIEFLVGEYVGPNRIVAKDQFCIEGYKNHPTTGYDFTVIKYGKDAIDRSIQDFMIVYENARSKGHTKQSTIKKVKKLQDKIVTSDLE